MKKLTVAAAALAAGVLTLAAQSPADAGHTSLRADMAAIDKHDKSAKAARTATDQAGETDKAGEEAQRAEARTKSASAQTKGGEAGQLETQLKAAALDKMSTAAVRPEPMLKAVASKAAEGLRKVAKSAGYAALVARYATNYGVPASLAHAVISIESNYREDARGKAGEIGLMQIKPTTAELMGYSGSIDGLFDPETNIKYGMKYLGKAHRLSGGSTCGTILKYNAGHSAKRMNPVSAAYCTKVKALLDG